MSEEQGKDPYFLYGASNFGSLLALAAYPAVIEPWLGLRMQVRLWAWGYAVLALLVAGCALLAIRKADPTSATPLAQPTQAAEVLTVARRLRWVAFSFVPSSLLLGVTAYITTDVAAIPLFWVVPLALYLLTFIFVFARRPVLGHALMVRLLPFGAAATALMLLTQASTPLVLVLGVHVPTFFVAAMVCHGELARDRPGATHLTEFYLWVSVGGVLGGVANGLLAPQIFDGLTEYPIALVLALVCRPSAATGAKEPWLVPRDGAFGFVMLVLTWGLVLGCNALHLDPSGHVFPLVFIAPIFLTYAQLHHPRRFALGIAALLVGGAGYDASVGKTLHLERNFFGVARVTRDFGGRFTQIAHGNTIHGRQWQDPARRLEPTAYYTRQGPLGQVFAELAARETRDGRTGHVGIVGLGAGGMAPYALPAERWTFYEINPAVVAIAENPAYFTFLRDVFAGSPRLSVVLGDARIRLGDADDGTYDMLVVDAFSSDAIPAHLLTREAIALYRRKLTPGGLLVVHISNRYLNLAPVLANLATDAGLTGYLRSDQVAGPTALGRWLDCVNLDSARPGRFAVSRDRAGCTLAALPGRGNGRRGPMIFRTSCARSTGDDGRVLRRGTRSA